MTGEQEDFQCWCGWIDYGSEDEFPIGYPTSHDKYAATVEMQFGERGVPPHEPSEDWNVPEPGPGDTWHLPVYEREQGEDDDAERLHGRNAL